MNKMTNPDQQARDRIATELNKSFFVEAGAGSGKTRCLVNRMAALIQKGNATIDTIAAITFTRKAAAELKERFQIKLEEIVNDKTITSPERDRVREALLRLEQSFVGTVHSFCARLLRERPVEAGIDPGFEEIEDDVNIVYAQQVWDAYTAKELQASNSIFEFIHENGVSIEDLKDSYFSIIEYPDVEIVSHDTPEPDFKDVKGAVDRFIKELLIHLPTTEPADGWDGLQSTMHASDSLIKAGYLKDNRQFVTLLKRLAGKTDIVQKRWTDKNKAKECKLQAEEFQNSTVFPALKKWQEYLHKPLIDFVVKGAKHYADWRKEHSVLNFQDLLMCTAALLKNNAEVREYFKSRITHLLVDEFQDTDPIQAEIIMLLSGKDNDTNNWYSIAPRPGSLFLVGDPKQSIYRFRRADIDIYNQVKALFKNNGDDVVELTSNFRSLSFIGDISNKVFVNLFPPGTDKYQAPFARLNTVRTSAEDGIQGVFKIAIPKLPGNNANKAAEVDANRIAAWMYECITKGKKIVRTDDERQSGIPDTIRPEDFMILAKGKARLPIYAKALEKLGIPYEISGGESFSESEELREILKVLKAVADPAAAIPLIAALRGLFFGLSDQDLYSFRRAGGRFSIFQKEQGTGKVPEALARLRQYYDISRHNAPVVALEMIIEQLGIIPYSLSQNMGTSRAGNVLKLIELFRGQDDSEANSFSGIVEYFKNSLENNGNGIEEMSVSVGAEKSVRIMNLHKAKGLEAPIVMLADPIGSSKEYAPYMHIERQGNVSKGYFVITKANGEFAREIVAMPLGWEEQADIEKQYEIAEKYRHDYVAVTRAKNMLVISTYAEGTKKKTWDSLYPYLKDMPELPGSPAYDAKAKAIFTIDKNAWLAEKEKMQRTIANVSQPSYKLATITETAKEGMTLRDGVAGGRSWGTIVHKALELCGRGKRDKLEIFAVDWLAEEGRSREELSKLVKLVDDIMKSDIWQRIQKAEMKYFELPFAIKDGDTTYSGEIDLVFKEPDGWIIVDYKTDDFENSAERKTAYNKQIALYADYWEQISGEKVKDKLLYKV